jgi:D-alanine-D-alanine ligase
MKIRSTHKPLPVLLLYNINLDWPPEDIEASNSSAKSFCGELQDEGHPVTVACLENDDLTGLLRQYTPNDYVVFNWCEEIPGIPHSYDLIAQTLEELGFTFTGADSKALSFSQDKRLVKLRLEACNISTPRWKIYSYPSSDGWEYFPAIVKPALEHCSYGVTRESVVWSEAELAARIRYVYEIFNQPALVEEFIDGREFHVTVIGNGKLDVFPIAEMDFSVFEDARDRLCTYESKFDPQSRPYNLIKLQLPAALTEAGRKDLTAIALDGYRAVDCRDYARLDIRLRDGVFYILDINPNADISVDTSLAMAAEQAGLSHGKLGSLLVHLASQRHPVFSVPVGKRMRDQ